MIHELIVERDEDIKGKIERFILEKGWESAYISGAIGSVKDLLFGTPVSMELPPKMGYTPCAGPAEVLAFTGEVMKRELMDSALKEVYKDPGPLFIHIHASAAISGGHVYGGGLQEGKAFRGLKVYIQPMP